MPTLLNSNNFLRWTGSFNAAPFTVVANNDTVNTFVNIVSIDIQPLTNDTASNGIDPSSLIITLQDNLTTPATWNQTTQKITYYLPTGVTAGVRILKYKFSDLNGNVSNEATITINVQARVTAWRAYAPSYSCQLDGGGTRTGNGVYAQLEKYYTDNSAPVLPQVLKANSSSDPNYIPPADDPNCNPNGYLLWVLSQGVISTACSLYDDGTVGNFYTHDYDTILTTGVYLYSDSTLTTSAGGGWFSDGSRKYRVNFGQIIDIQFCGTELG